MSSKARVLIVDDNHSLVRVAERVLQKAGFEVLTAFDGLEGLRKAQEEKPNLIILDIIMPKMDGYEVCHRLKTGPATADIPVIMLTVKGKTATSAVEADDERLFHTRVQDRARGFDAGAIEFLSKPIKAKELVKRVRAVLYWGGGRKPQRDVSGEK